MAMLGVVPLVGGIIFGADAGWWDSWMEACGRVATCVATTMVTSGAGSWRGLLRRPFVVFCVCPCSVLCGSGVVGTVALQGFLLCLLVVKSESPARGLLLMTMTPWWT